MKISVPVNRTNAWTSRRDEFNLLGMIEWYQEHVYVLHRERYWETVYSYVFEFTEEYSEDAVAFKLKFGL